MSFEERLAAFHRSHGRRWAVPSFMRSPLNVEKLWNTVQARGGYDEVRGWAAVTVKPDNETVLPTLIG